MLKTTLKIAVLGVGHLGKIHLQCLQATPFEVVGFFDPDDNNAANAIDRFGLRRFTDYESLLSKVDAVDIVVPTSQHYQVAQLALKHNKHVFIEKPLTSNIMQARELVELATHGNLIAQVGHVERYNPAFLSVKDRKLKPRFIEAHRLAVFNNRGNDVSVVMDLMIHDLDLILSVVNEEVIEVRASGVPVINETADICNARVSFANGCVANITASRISMKNMRKVRMFQADAYVSVDFLEKESQIVSLSEVNKDIPGMTIDVGNKKKKIEIEMPEVENNNAIVQELNDFFQSIEDGTQPLVSIMDGYNALLLAEEIERKMAESLEKLKP